MDVPFSEWLKNIRGTEREAEIETEAVRAENQREIQEDILFELYCDREFDYAF